jgi:Collagen triple helix repeat (20 copies)
MRRNISYANVAATLALVFSMSGGALAASRYLINSTKQINPKVMKALKGNAGAGGPQGPAGLAGPQGAAGTQGKEGQSGKEGASGKAGTNGATNVVVRYAEVTTSSGNDGQTQAKCNAGERATGGGVEMASGDSKDVWYFTPSGRPVPNTQGATPTGWFANWYNESASTDTFRVYVICASP